MNKQEQFFYKHAGFSYDPKTQTPEQGKAECAKALADAETLATAHGYSFEWTEDSECSAADFRDDTDYALWCCIMRNDDGDVVGSLRGIDFGPGGEPWGNDYRRVVEAELALEHME